MFNLNSEVDEIRFEYYIKNNLNSKDEIIFSINDLSKILKISRSKAQRLIDKFIKLNEYCDDMDLELFEYLTFVGKKSPSNFRRSQI